MSELFEYIKQKTIEPITLNWDTSNVTDMNHMFYACEQDFILNFRRQAVGNECLTALCDTSNVTNMQGMFDEAYTFNQPLNFNTSSVTNMNCMFCHANNYNQPLLFDTSNVKDMSWMFSAAKNFNQPLNFDTRAVKKMNCMFCNATNFNQSIYFQANDKDNYRDIFKNSQMEGQENKYVLEPPFYSKLLLFYTLNQINPELLYLCDDFEDYIKV